MDPVESAILVAGKGIVGNANQGGRRQVTIIEQEAWDDVMRELRAALPPSARRANLMLRGVRLQDSRGRTLRVGGCRIRIFGETKPCAQMDGALPGLREAMYADWRGGAFGEVLDDGRIAVGDIAAWVEGE
jgi:MOSC domain-containing protein YiiM